MRVICASDVLNMGAPFSAEPHWSAFLGRSIVNNGCRWPAGALNPPPWRTRSLNHPLLQVVWHLQMRSPAVLPPLSELFAGAARPMRGGQAPRMSLLQVRCSECVVNVSCLLHAASFKLFPSAKHACATRTAAVQVAGAPPNCCFYAVSGFRPAAAQPRHERQL